MHTFPLPTHKRFSIQNKDRTSRELRQAGRWACYRSPHALAPETERPPRGGLSEIRSGVSIRRQL